MTKDKKTDKKNCGGKSRIMLAYGLIQLGTRVVSALSLVVIALSFCSVKDESTIFTACVNEIQESGQSKASAVRFCNGGWFD